MGDPESAAKHKKRIRKKATKKAQSHIAKDLRTRKYKMRVVEDKRGKEWDLKNMSHQDLVNRLQELDDE